MGWGCSVCGGSNLPDMRFCGYCGTPRAAPMAIGGTSLELHIGVNTGRVISGDFGTDLSRDYSILGDAVNVAQRLESVAGAGDTLVGAMTYELTKDEFDLEPVGPLTLKGKAEDVSAWRVLGRRSEAAAATEASE